MYQNPIGASPLHMGDPFVLRHEGVYYLFGTTDPDEGFSCYRSSDLVRWEKAGWAWRKTAESWAQGAFWAPEVISYRGRFYMTYSGRVRGSSSRNAIELPADTAGGSDADRLLMALAVSDAPEGPYRDLHAPWFDPGYSTIDGHIFVDDDQTPYLYFSRNGFCDGYSFGIIYGVQLNTDLSSLEGNPIKLLEAGQEWEKVDWSHNRCNEGAAVIKRGSLYYMTYSANHTEYAGYGVGYATSAHPLGPWTKAAENPILASNLSLGVSAPGHNSLVLSPDGSELFIVYHTHADAARPSFDRVVNIDRILFDRDGRLRVIGPTRTPQPMPSGASQDRHPPVTGNK